MHVINWQVLYILLLVAAECRGFSCGDDSCVPLSYRCDGDNDCTDETDELDCVAVVEGEG
jgi:hypothetical protein